MIDKQLEIELMKDPSYVLIKWKNDNLKRKIKLDFVHTKICIIGKINIENEYHEKIELHKLSFDNFINFKKYLSRKALEVIFDEFIF